MRTLRSKFSKALVLLFLAVTCLVVAFIPTFGAKAQTADASDFYMMQGASVRLGSSESSETFKGIRFGSVITTSYYNELGSGVELHTLYGPANKFNAITELTVDNYASKGFKDFKYENLIATTEDGVEAYRFNLVIDYSNLSSELLDTAFGVELMVRTYAKTANGDIIYAVENDNVRSMRGVALEALEKETNLKDWQVKALSQYVALTDSLTEYENGEVATVDVNGNFVVINYDTEYVGEYKAFIGAEYIGNVKVTDGTFNVNPANFVEGNEYALKLVATNGSVVKQTVTYSAETTKSSVTLEKAVDVELSRPNVTTFDIDLSSQADLGTLSKVTLVNGETSIEIGSANYSLANNILSVSLGAIGVRNFGKDLSIVADFNKVNSYGIVNEVVSVEKPFSTVSMVIRNADDLDAMQTVADGLMDDSGSAKYFDGLFVLGNSFNYGRNYSTIQGNNTASNYGGGFMGTLDGRGYVIDNLTMIADNSNAATGIFSQNNGVIKNISFTNANFTALAWSNSFIAQHNYGTTENIFVHLTSVTATGKARILGGSQFYPNATKVTKNCMVIVDNKIGTGALWAHAQDNGTITNVYGIGPVSEVSVGDCTVTNAACYASVSAAQGKISTTGWDTSFWTISNGIPMPKNVTISPELEAVEDQTIYGGKVINVEYNAMYQTVSVEGNATVSGGVVTIGEVAQGDEVTIIITDNLTGNEVSTTLTCSVKSEVMSAQYVEMSDNTAGIASWVDYKTNIEKVADYTYKADYAYQANATIDISSCGFDSITSATIDGIDVLSTSSANALVFAKSVFTKPEFTKRGEVVATVMGVKGDGLVVVTIPVVLADILISNADDFEAMQWLADPYVDDDATYQQPSGTYNVKMGGYIALTNNIAYNRTYKVHHRSLSWTIDNHCGFMGTLDGRGFTVDGLEMVEQPYATSSYTHAGFINGAFTSAATWSAGSGIFASLSGNATIKNIAFTNAKHSCGGGFITSVSGQGGNRIENVYVHLTYARGVDTKPVDRYSPAGIFNARNHGKSFVVQNCFVKIDSVANVYYDLGSFTTGKNQAGETSNIFIVSANSRLIFNADAITEIATHSGVTKYADVAAATADKAAWSAGLTSSIWDVTGDLPIFASTEAPEVEPEVVSYTLVKEYVELSDLTKGITSYRTNNANYRAGYAYDANYVIDLTEYLDGANVKSVMLGETDYVANYLDGKLTFAKADLKSLYGNNTFVLSAEVEDNGVVVKKININIPVYFADVVFTTGEDFIAMPHYAGKAGLNGAAYQLDPNAHSAETPVLGGHFVLANNLDCSGFTYSMVYAHDDGINGFWHGVLDGDGHVVNNLTMANNHALFATHYKSTIKNIALTNVVWTSNNIYRGFLAWNFRESENVYENMYIQFKSVSSATNAFLLGFNYSNGGVKFDLNNVIIQVDEMLGTVSYYATIAGQLYDPTTSNVIVVGGDKLIAANKTIPSGITKVATYSDISVNASNWDSAYWTVTDGVPYFNGTLTN